MMCGRLRDRECASYNRAPPGAEGTGFLSPQATSRRSAAAETKLSAGALAGVAARQYSLRNGLGGRTSLFPELHLLLANTHNKPRQGDEPCDGRLWPLV